MLRPSVQSYEYSLMDYSVTDGDTVQTLLDLGFDVLYQAACRLNGIDAPEHTTAAGKAVKQVVQVWMSQRAYLGFVVNSMSLDKFAGRYDGRIRSATLFKDDKTRCLNDFLLANQLVRPYSGDKKLPWLPEELKAIEDAAVSVLKGMGYYPPLPVAA